jgi:hypothetical protein
MARFSAKEDWKFIDWRATLLTNLYRAVSAGVVWLLLGLIFGMLRENPTITLTMPILFPLVYFCVLLPLGLFATLLSRVGIPFAGLFSLVAGFTIVVGDPLLWIFDRLTKKSIVPVKDLPFLNLALIYFVVNEEKKAAARA